MSTIDGKITSATQTDILSKDYFELYTKTENLLPVHTGWMCGRVTMHMFADPDTTALPALSTDIDDNDFITSHIEKMYMFGIDTKGKLRWDKNTITLSNVTNPLHLVVIVTAATPKEYLQYLRSKQISYLIAGKDTIQFSQLFSTVREKLGVEGLLVEGGGLLNGSIMESDCIDEISLLLTPTVINQSKAPSLFEHEPDSPNNLRQFTLKTVQQLEKNTIWLRYTKSS